MASNSEDVAFDVFVSYASEDRERFAVPLVTALKERGVSCWYDQEQIRVGDDFRRRMDDGLARARFGVVILSPRYFKYWTQAELSALFAQESADASTRILPVRCDLDYATLAKQSPLLAGRASLAWEEGVGTVAQRIAQRVRDQKIESQPRSPVYGLPARRAQTLFGRDRDLAALDAWLQPGQSVRVTASVEGLAGVGKTELALHLADRLARTDRFPGGIFWFDAENPDLTVAWGTTFADALAVGPGTPEERAAGAVRAASNGPNVLLILDNVEEWTRKSAPHPLPDGPRVSLLVTTRRRSLGGQSFKHHTLEVLPADAAKELLISVAGRDLANAAGTAELLGHLDGHSLAIELAGAYLRELPGVTPADYLRKLEEGLPVEEKVQDLVRYEATVGRALEIHWTRLAAAEREALLVAASFAPEDASVELLETCGVDDDLQQPLRRHHLIAGDGQRWRMHRLVREWALRRATPDELAAARRRFVEGCVEYSRRIDLGEGFRVYRADGAHLELAAGDAQEVLGADDERVSLLFGRLGTALQSLGDLPRAKELHEFALQSALENLGEHDPAVATRRSNLALVLKDLGDLPRAKELLELALQSDLENLGEHHPNVATGRSNLAIVLRNLGDLPRAKELLELALQSALNNLGEHHPAVATRRSNLALVLQDLGDLPRAKELLELALQSDLENLGEHHPTVAIRRSNLALVLKDLGDLPRAKELLELALQSDLENFGEDHPSVAIRRFNLASIQRDAGDLAEAARLLKMALSAEERSLGADHPSTAFTRASLAEVSFRLGETAAARQEIERALRAVASQPAGSNFRMLVERVAERIREEPS